MSFNSRDESQRDSQLSPCGHLTVADILIIQTVATVVHVNSWAKCITDILKFYLKNDYCY